MAMKVHALRRPRRIARQLVAGAPRATKRADRRCPHEHRRSRADGDAALAGRVARAAAQKKPVPQLGRGDSATEEVTLRRGAAERLEAVPYLLGLDAFGDDVEAEIAAEVDGGPD